MTGRQHFLGVHREDGHSPGHEENDAAILQATAASLCRRGHDVRLCRPEHIERELDERPGLVFSMCETPRHLAVLDRAAALGIPVLNRPDGVRNTYRHRMIRLLAASAARFPASEIVRPERRPPWPCRPIWLKRFDFHATQSDDVLFADDEASWIRSLERFAGRGFTTAVAQDHVVGDLVKFYGVSGGWFRWFHHQDQRLAGHSFDAAALAQTARIAAQALGVAIFGGDAIIASDQSITIVDLNAWPSYARFRDAASAAIADMLESRRAPVPASARVLAH